MKIRAALLVTCVVLRVPHTLGCGDDCVADSFRPVDKARRCLGEEVRAGCISSAEVPPSKDCSILPDGRMFAHPNYGVFPGARRCTSDETNAVGFGSLRDCPKP